MGEVPRETTAAPECELALPVAGCGVQMESATNISVCLPSAPCSSLEQGPVHPPRYPQGQDRLGILSGVTPLASPAHRYVRTALCRI